MSRTRSFAHEWIDLVERSGLLVSEPVLHRFFPAGPEPVEPRHQRVLLGAWERFQVAPEDAQRQSAWLDAVFHFLEWPDDALVQGNRLPPSASVDLPDFDQSLHPHGLLTGEDGRFLLGLWRVSPDQQFGHVERKEGTWRATPHKKLESWMRLSGTPFGLLTNGHSFRLVHVPQGLPEAWIEFSSSLLFEEKSVLDGFSTLLRAERFFGSADRRLEALAEASQKTQAELTDSLGLQVRNAVETLILALDSADRRGGGRSFHGVDPEEIYKAAVYVVMRLVFILFAEENDLLPHGSVFFDESYGLGRLLHLLEEEKRTRPETFESALDAWPRLLALFRLIFHGSSHPDLTLPAYGGDLFSPAGFPALAALQNPFLKLSNQAVYWILRDLTFGEARIGRERLAQRYSYRNLDVEHIGYLYEGLLDHRAARAGREPLVKLANGTETALPLSELEQRVGAELVDFLAERDVAGGDLERIAARLASPSHEALADLGSLSPHVAERCRPYAGVLQTDSVVEPLRLYLTTSASRRSTGTHYTPIQYTRAMVAETLDPLIYAGEHGKLEEPRRLRTPRELLDLKVCDPAMGSGAFLVQVIRYLGEKLTDAWQVERERQGDKRALYLPYAEPAADREDRIPLPDEREEAELWARRFVAERCVYGVDKNPLAVEMAKLSIWLVTLARDKPFSFVDHALKAGDSLLGLSSLDQLRTWSLDGKSEHRGLFEKLIEEKVDRAVVLRRQIADSAVQTPADVARKEQRLAEANEATRELWALADLLVSTVLRSKKAAKQEVARSALLAESTHRLDDPEGLEELVQKELHGQELLHWPLAFPEVFEAGGFHAFVGNPPYMGGQKLTGAFGEPYREFLVHQLAAGMRGSADLVSYFFLRTYGLLREEGNLGLLAVNTIAEGHTRQVGLEQLLCRDATIYSAHPNEPWPRKAAVVTSRVHVHRGEWKGTHRLRNIEVPTISAYLTSREEWTPKQLKANEGIAFQGSIVLGMGFILNEEEALAMLERDPRNADVLFPYLNGEDLNSHPEQKPSRWVINFWDWPEERARTYQRLFDIVQQRVKPQRIANKRKIYRDHWWHFAEKRPALYHAIGRYGLFEHQQKSSKKPPLLSNILVRTQVSRTWAFALVPNSSIFDQRLVVFASDQPWLFALLQSAIHLAWSSLHASSLKLDMTYTPSDCFDNCPLPDRSSTYAIIRVGDNYHHSRVEVMHNLWIGLTDFYKLFHNPQRKDGCLVQLRDLQVELDYAVSAAYGWSDLALQHDFRQVSYIPGTDRVRFSISEDARHEILHRLSQLNRERYEEEVAQGLHEEVKPSKRISKGKKTTLVVASEPFSGPPQTTLFPVKEQMGFWEAPQPSGDGNGLTRSASDLLTWLRKGNDWRSRSEAVEALGLSTSDWNQAIQELLAAGLAERTGEKRGTRYRAK